MGRNVQTMVDDYSWFERLVTGIREAQKKHMYVCGPDGALVHDGAGRLDEFCRDNFDSNLLELTMDDGTCYLPAESAEYIAGRDSAPQLKLPALLCTDKLELLVKAFDYIAYTPGLTTARIHEVMSLAYDYGLRPHHIEYFKKEVLKNESNAGFMLLIWPDNVRQGVAVTTIDPLAETFDYSNEGPPLKYGFVVTSMTAERDIKKGGLIPNEGYLSITAAHERIHGAISKYVWRKVKERSKNDPSFVPPKNLDELAEYKVNVIAETVRRENLQIDRADLLTVFPDYIAAFLMTQPQTASHALTILPQEHSELEEIIVVGLQSRMDKGSDLIKDHIHLAETSYDNNIGGLLENHSYAAGLALAYVYYHLAGRDEKAIKIDQEVKRIIGDIVKPNDTVDSAASQVAMNIGMTYLAAKKIFLAGTMVLDEMNNYLKLL